MRIDTLDAPRVASCADVHAHGQWGNLTRVNARGARRVRVQVLRRQPALAVVNFTRMREGSADWPGVRHAYGWQEQFGCHLSVTLTPHCSPSGLEQKIDWSDHELIQSIGVLAPQRRSRNKGACRLPRCGRRCTDLIVA
jgi:hypothetical protein